MSLIIINVIVIIIINSSSQLGNSAFDIAQNILYLPSLGIVSQLRQ